MRFGHYYRCHQEIIRITSHHLGGNRPTCTTYRTLFVTSPITATHISLGSTRQARFGILPKDTNTLALAGLELTTFRLWVLLCSARPHALSFLEKKIWNICTVSKWWPNNRFSFRVILISALIWKTTFPKEFFNEIWLKLGDHEYINIAVIKFW